MFCFSFPSFLSFLSISLPLSLSLFYLFFSYSRLLIHMDTASHSFIKQHCVPSSAYTLIYFTSPCVLDAHLCLTLCDPIDCSPPGSSVHGILQARVLDWKGKPFLSPGDLPEPGIKPGSPALQDNSLLSESPGKPSLVHTGKY